MKTRRINLMILTYFVVVSQLIGQDFGAIGTKWYYSGNGAGSCFGNCDYILFESVKDTTIKGHITHKITQRYFSRLGDTLNYEPIYVYSQTDTVYMYNFSKSRFLKLYIFNGKQGDTLILDRPDDIPWTDSTYRLVIDTLINIVVDGVPLKKFGTTALDDYKFYNLGGYFIERIGGLDWFLPRAAIILEADGPIRCYMDSKIDTSFQSVACDYILVNSIGKTTREYNIEISPNPMSDKLIIKTDLNIEKSELINMSGKIVLSTKELLLDVSRLPNGLYFLLIRLETGDQIKKKVIKNAH